MMAGHRMKLVPISGNRTMEEAEIEIIKATLLEEAKEIIPTMVETLTAEEVVDSIISEEVEEAEVTAITMKVDTEVAAEATTTMTVDSEEGAVAEEVTKTETEARVLAMDSVEVAAVEVVALKTTTTTMGMMHGAPASLVPNHGPLSKKKRRKMEMSGGVQLIKRMMISRSEHLLFRNQMRKPGELNLKQSIMQKKKMESGVNQANLRK